ncbi:MAG: TonB-dependent receptor [Bacteroidales bacterium]
MYSQTYLKGLLRIVLVTTLICLCSLNAGAQISMSLKNVSVREAVEYLQKEYHYSFTMSTDEIKINNLVTVQAKNATLQTVLDQIFSGQQVTYKVIGKNVIVSSKIAAEAKQTKQTQQNKTLVFSGKVFYEDSYPMPGAAVIEKGTQNGVATKADGSFEIRTTSPTPTLVFSFFGYDDVVMEMKSGSKSGIVVRMNPQPLALDDVVVVGYGSMTRRDITSAISSLKLKPSERRDVLSVDQLIQGRIAGVNISTASGVLGASSRVSIRGIGSLNAGNEPLYVVDGIPLTSTSGDTGAWSAGESMTGLATINPSDIESVEVLKDAASAAIYGSRGTNGVIIITTKSGKKGAAKVAIDASASLGYMPRTDKLEVASGDLFIETLNEAVDNYNIQYGKTMERFINPMPGKATHNWMNDVLRTAFSRNLSASISGGSDAITYYVSGTVKHQEGVAVDNRLNQYSLKANISGKIKPWLFFGVNTQLSYTKNDRVASGYSGLNIIKAAVEQYPWDEPYLPKGEWATSKNVLVNNNPLQAIKESDVWIKTYRALSNAYLRFHILKGLDFKTSLGEDFYTMEEHVYFTANHQSAYPSKDNPLGGSLTDSRKNRSTILWENTLSYDHKFDFGINLNAVLGHSAQIDDSSTASQVGIGFPSPSFDVNSVAAEIKSATSGASAYAMQSFFARMNLNYKDRYVGTLTMRADGSSKFAPGNRYGYFPSASLGWNIDKEPWWNSDDITLKVRASIGATGNQGSIGAYAYQALASGGVNYNNINGLGLTTAGNQDLKWESAVQQDLGVDASFWKGALSFTADVFNKDTRNLLYNKPTMVSTGYTSYTCNIGSMNNKGLELTVAGNLGKHDFRWRGDFNISFIRNKLTKLLDDNEIVRPDNFHALKVGEEVGSFYMIKMLGIYQHDEDVPEYLYENEGVRAGDVIFDDYHEDGKIDADDRQIVGSANPDFSGGFNNTFTWKNLELAVFMTYSYGQSIYEFWTGGVRLGNGTWPQLKSACEGRWTGPGTTNSTPRAIYGQSWNSTKFYNSRFLHDASYLRMRSISLGYNLPSKWLSSLKMEATRIYFQVDNAWTWTKWPYLDPEVSYSSNASTFGVDWLNPGQPRTFLLGLNIKF